MTHFTPAVTHMRAALPVVGMVTLLAERKATLQSMIAERHRQARETGTVANVAMLSATLRLVKRQLATAEGRAGGA